MNETNQRKQWAEHLQDEADALGLQQQSAGDSHTPVEGPLPHSADQLAIAVGAAVSQERLRCAKVAESWSSETRLLEAFGDFTERELRAAAVVARAIGREIRGGAGPRTAA
jgi:hypothetical protein